MMVRVDFRLRKVDVLAEDFNWKGLRPGSLGGDVVYFSEANIEEKKWGLVVTGYPLDFVWFGLGVASPRRATELDHKIYFVKTRKAWPWSKYSVSWLTGWVRMNHARREEHMFVGNYTVTREEGR